MFSKKFNFSILAPVATLAENIWRPCLSEMFLTKSFRKQPKVGLADPNY